MINENWGTKEIVENIKALKIKFNKSLVSFSYFKLNDRAKYIRSIRDEFYQLKIDQWKINLLWDYMNNDIEYEEIKRILN